MKQLKVLIVEDELLIAETIRIYLNERGHTVIGIAISYDEALSLLASTKPDIVLLDVRLYGEKSGIDLAAHLNNSNKKIPYIMVSSQYDSGIIEKAMHAGASGYITKPIAKETLWSSVEMAVLKQQDTLINETYIDLKTNHEMKRILAKDILFIKADHVYVEIVLNEGSMLCRYTLREMLKKINLPNFIQCHRSYIINTDKIQKYSSRKVWIEDETIPVSEKYKNELSTILNTPSGH